MELAKEFIWGFHNILGKITDEHFGQPNMQFLLFNFPYTEDPHRQGLCFVHCSIVYLPPTSPLSPMLFPPENL